MHTQHAAGLPRLSGLRPRLAATTYAIPPVDWSTGDRVREILNLIAEADAVLATGHLSVDEVAWLLGEARQAGITRLLLTHPSYTVPAMSATQAAELTRQGSYAEITATQHRSARGGGRPEELTSRFRLRTAGMYLGRSC